MDKVFLVHFPLILEEDSANFMQVTPFYFKSNFALGKLKKLG